MAESSIKSEFEFVSYRVDMANFAMKPELSLLLKPTIEGNLHWNINITVRRPTFFSSAKLYVAGLDMAMQMTRLPEVGEHSVAEAGTPVDGAKEAVTDVLAGLQMGIVGSFRSNDGRFEKTIEEQLVKVQAPTILFSYLRSASSLFLANAGFAGFVMPLINVHELAKQQLANVTIDAK